MNLADIPLPKDPRHQRLVDLLLTTDLCRKEAYRTVYPRAKESSASPMAARILKRPDVVAYETAMRRAAQSEAHLTLEEKRNFLARVVRCRIDQEPNDSDLWQEIRDHETETSITRHRKLPSKTDCIKLDNELAGDDPATNAIDQLAQALAKLR